MKPTTNKLSSTSHAAIGFSICLLFLAAAAGRADADRDDFFYSPRRSSCSATTTFAFRACRNEARDDFWIAVANCHNISDRHAKAECLEENRYANEENLKLCRAQSDARDLACEKLGEAPYDPQLDPAVFVDFQAVIDGKESFNPNQYWPLVPGTTHNYEVKDEAGIVIEQTKWEVLNETIEIVGINCIVVRDRVWEIDAEGNRSLIEDTDDWFAQDMYGTVWYMGEEVKDYADGILTAIDGSFMAGRGFDKPGIIMTAHPVPGEYYRQEFSLGNAEDISEHIEILGSLTIRGVTYHQVLKTAETIPLEPDVLDYKFFAPGVGLVMSSNLDGETLELQEVILP
ncbi:MAG: hypothetical protein KC897_01765 [Candidatus Omnitrophica bacterium]|nr:hypothetical protein [Candidatus Omnitrophota bacterium]MCB9721953.1 hypothetical protein [Candidatus Omnitrophota bacterium]